MAPQISQSEPAQTQNLLKAINSLQWINVTNSLIASGDPATLIKVKTLIQNLDIPLRQVFIEVLVIETNMTNSQNFGLQWGGKMQYLNRFGAGTGNFPLQGANTSNVNTNFPVTDPFPASLGSVSATNTPNATSMIPFFTGFDLGIIGDIIMHKGQSFISLGSLVNALQLDTDSTVVMNPKIITQDNRNSTIFVGQNVPFVGSLVASQSSFVQTNQNIEYRDIGFNLSITPTIGNSDIVTLDISNDISEVIGSPNQGTNSNNTNQQPTGILTSHTNMNTRVHVPDKHFVVLSGMIQESKTRFKTSIPCLGALPVIGALFSENDRLDQKNNVIIFVRPHIINTYEDYKKVTSTQEDIYKDQAKIRILKEEFDEAIDLIKYPENE
jgi:type III secretion protein C